MTDVGCLALFNISARFALHCWDSAFLPYIKLYQIVWRGILLFSGYVRQWHSGIVQYCLSHCSQFFRPLLPCITVNIFISTPAQSTSQHSNIMLFRILCTKYSANYYRNRSAMSWHGQMTHTDCNKSVVLCVLRQRMLDIMISKDSVYFTVFASVQGAVLKICTYISI